MHGNTGLVAPSSHRPAGLGLSTPRVRPRPAIAVALCAAMLAGCAAPRPAARNVPAATVAAAPAVPVVRTPVEDTVILVGRIEVTPPLEQPAQVAAGAQDDYRNQAQLLFGERPSVLDAPDAPATVAVTVGEHFFVPYKRTKALYYSGGVVGRSPFRINGYGGSEFPFAQPELQLRGTFRIDLKPGDRALYLGTFRYIRDGQGVTKMRRIDDYPRARAEFEQRHPARALRRAVLQKTD